PTAPTPPVASAPGVVEGTPLAADARLEGGVIVGAAHYWFGFPARPRAGQVNVVVEVPAGTAAKFEVDHEAGVLRWEERGGAPRVIDYLPYPANYGMLPRTLLPEDDGGDGDPLDVLVLGPALPRGGVVEARVVAVLGLLDEGEADDKLIAVPATPAYADVRDLRSLDARFRGARTILETFFSYYEGEGVTELRGWGDAEEAEAFVDHGAAAFEAAHPEGA
ncbi:MAG: inorganic diphosphatase, partial [Myxococcota bacterium]